MISNILPYVNSYDDVRAVLGVPDEELEDKVLGLAIYRNTLGLALNRIVGEYPADAGDRTLIEIFEALDVADPMYIQIQMFSTYYVADTVAGNLPMIGVKTKADGKSTVTRHSAESTYLTTKAAIKDKLAQYALNIRELFTATPTETQELYAIAPTIDVVTGE